MAQRKRLRLCNYDYGSAGAYLVTVCVRDRRCLLGRVEDDTVRLSATGRLVAGALAGIGAFHPGVDLDSWVVMPNHVHAILFLDRTRFRPPPVPAIVGAFKARASRRAGKPLWQRGYHDRIVRDEGELQALREYVLQNPRRWALDRENPDRGPASRARAG